MSQRGIPHPPTVNICDSCDRLSAVGKKGVEVRLRNQLRPLSLAVALALADAPAHAATIVVTDGGDNGSGTTCTLRQAIESANKNKRGMTACMDGSGNDTIQFAENLVGSTITLAGTELDVKGPLTLAGSGQTIDAGNASRVMYVGFTTLNASNIDLVNGAAPGNSGAGLFVLSSTVSLTNVGISGNHADYAAGVAAFNYSELRITESTISGNSAAHKGGGLELVNGTNAVLEHSTVAANSASRGGGIFVSFYAELSLTQSSVSGNTAIGAPPQSAGGIYGYRCGSVNLVGTLVSANVGNYRGGGIAAVECSVTLVNSTITGNTSTYGGGGAIYLNHADASIVNATISGNSAQDVGGLLAVKSSATLENSILSANTVDAAHAATVDLAFYDSSTVDAESSLLGSALDASAFNGASSHNRFSDSPGLGPLQDNGGATDTMAALDGSIVIDAGDNALAQIAGHSLLYDQRAGHLRIVNGTVDIGAFEYQPDRIFTSPFEALP